MRTTESMGKIEVLRYLAHGFALQNAINQAKSTTLHRHDVAINKVSESLSWWCELHQEAIKKLSSVEGWARASQISDRPEVVRDLLSVGLIECEHRPSERRSDNIVCWFKKSLNYLEAA